MATSRRFAVALGFAALAAATTTKYELLDYNSQASANAMKTVGKARFTVLTDSLLRMEYDADGKFEDRPSLAFVNRMVEVPQFTSNATATGITIQTAYFKFTYEQGTGDFSTAKTMKAEPVGSSTFQPWSHGDTSRKDEGNLRGTFRTLDDRMNISLACDDLAPAHCEYGLISTSGWALFDETGVPVLDEDDWWADASGKMLKNVDDEDLYLFMHSKRYMDALRDYTSVGGKIPIFPRANHGVWFTRWYDYVNLDVEKMVREYEEHDIPLDIFVFDMNWHTKEAWGGYTFDPHLYPFPKDTLDFLHYKGLHVAANLHDDNGILKNESRYLAACQAMGLSPANPGSAVGIPFTLTNKSYVNTLEDVVMLPVEQMGMDFWWIDWQQGETKGNTGQDGPRKKMNPTIWTDKMRSTDSIRRCKQGLPCTNKRGVMFGRWGGLGNHRYQHGFSGDVLSVAWQNLAYQAYFSATATNVGWGWWSHDIVGPGDSHEMYLRWIQLSALSGISRAHDRGLSSGRCKHWPTETTGCHNVRPYNVPLSWREMNIAALRLRSALVPYIYTHTRIAFETGVGLLRPMYYHFPDSPEAYPADMNANLGQEPTTRQYMFGEDILAAPVTKSAGCGPSSGILEFPCGVTSQDVWLPPGKWHEIHSGAAYDGPALLRGKGFAAGEIPLYVRPGAVVPMTPAAAARGIGRAARRYEAMDFHVYPGGSSGSARVYDDDGATYDYLKGDYSWWNASYAVRDTRMTFTLAVADSGSYTSSPSKTVGLRIHSAPPPVSVTQGSAAVPYARYPPATGPFWTYDGEELAVVVQFAPAGGRGMEGAIDFAAAPAGWAGNGTRLRMARVLAAKRTLDEVRDTPGSSDKAPEANPGLMLAASTAAGLSYLAGANATLFFAQLQAFPGHYNRALEEVRSMLPESRLVCPFTESADVTDPVPTPSCPHGLPNRTQVACCDACNADADCEAFVFNAVDGECRLLAGHTSAFHVRDRVVGLSHKNNRFAYALDLLTKF
ncbi:Alpha-xylosidase [Diplonema papillatum]|nr:Alpha-xylosidase [Diplonema papillatum]